MTSHRGFTLVELAVVLVIIAIIVAMVTGGKKTIEAAKVNNLITMAKDISGAVRTFRDKYKYLPGDYPNASNTIANLPAACSVDTSTPNIGNGAIDTATESSCAVEELFRTGLLKATLKPGATYYTIDSEFGDVRIIAAQSSNVTQFRLSTNVVEFANVPCEIVMRADEKLDDGDIRTASTGKAKASIDTCTDGTLVPFYAVAMD